MHLLSLIVGFFNSSCVFYLELLYYCLGDLLVVGESVEIFSSSFLFVDVILC